MGNDKAIQVSLEDFINSNLKGIVELTEEGYIKTNEFMETNVERVYAVGDIRPKELRQLVTAISDGGTAISRIEKYVFELREKLNLPRIEREEDFEENGILDSDMKKNCRTYKKI